MTRLARINEGERGRNIMTDQPARERARILSAEDALRTLGRPLPDRPAPPDRFAETLAAAAAFGPRFELAAAWSGSPEDRPKDRIVGSELTEAQLEHAVALRGAGLKTPDLKVAANMWFQWYCHRMAAPLLASWVLHRRVPDVSAENITFRFDAEGRPEHIAMIAMRASGLPGDIATDADLNPTVDLLPEITRVLLDGHLLPLGERLKARYRLGAPITKGTIASQIGMALTTIDAQSSLTWEQVTTDALRLLEHTSPQLDSLTRSGDLICLQSTDRTGMFYRRGTCCLVYRAPNKSKCGGCPLHSDDDRARVYTDRLAERLVSPAIQKLQIASSVTISV